MINNNNFKSDTIFRKDMIRILIKIFEEKLPDFLDYCIHTNNANPIMEVYYLMSINTFDKE